MIRERASPEVSWRATLTWRFVLPRPGFALRLTLVAGMLFFVGCVAPSAMGSGSDAGPRDAGLPDAGAAADGGATDAGESDAGRTDAGESDAGEGDAGEGDAGLPGDADAGVQEDGGEADAGTTCPDGNALGSDTDCSACGLACPANGEEFCVASACVPDFDWSQWLVPPDAPPDSEYTVSADDTTVADSVTGLVWQRAVPSGLYTSGSAQAYCAGLTLGGYASGWRVPTLVELVSIVDVAASSPAIDSTAFPATPSYYFATSSTYDGDSSQVFVVLFANGVAVSYGASFGANVRCVR